MSRLKKIQSIGEVISILLLWFSIIMVLFLSGCSTVKPLAIYTPLAVGDYAITKRNLDPWDTELSPIARQNQELAQILYLSSSTSIDVALQHKNNKYLLWGWRAGNIIVKSLAMIISSHEDD